MQKLEAILFDLEGTLVDSAFDILKALNEMLSEEQRPHITMDQLRGFLGEGTMEMCRHALNLTGGCKTNDLYPYVQKFINHYRSIYPDPAQIYPGVRETMEALRKAKVKIGLCTNKPEAASKRLMEQLLMIDYFDFIAGGDTFQVHKPNPEHVTGVLSALGTTNQNSVFVGDGPRDVVACFRASLPCIIVMHGQSFDYDETPASAFMEEFDELPAKIEQLGFDPSPFAAA